MTTLDSRLLEIEGELERGLLRANYDALTDDSGQQCRDLVVEYVSLAQDVSDKDVGFIKDLTKVAHHVIDSSSSLDEFLERIYQFNIAGVEKVRAGIGGIDPTHLPVLESHFLVHAGSIAQTIFKKTGDVSWAVKWYESRILSAQTSIEVDPMFSARSYSFAAKAAQTLYNETGDVSWAVKWYESEFLSAETSAELDARFSAYSYAFAADVAKTIFEKTFEISWAVKWYESRILSAQTSIEVDPKHSAHSHGFAGDASRMIFERTRDLVWAQKAVESYSRFLEYFYRHPNPQLERVMEDIEFHTYNLKGLLPST